jgi:hypothetical protein
MPRQGQASCLWAELCRADPAPRALRLIKPSKVSTPPLLPGSIWALRRCRGLDLGATKPPRGVHVRPGARALAQVVAPNVVLPRFAMTVSH